jgi:organic radical activating enzyme
MASRRTKSISTKVTPEEYARLVALAGDETISEWARGALLRAHAPSATDAALLAEVLALRTILLNLHFTICGGEPLTADAMQRFITRADQDKLRLAHERLQAAITGRQS